MFVHAVLSLLLLFVFYPIIKLTILGSTPSTRGRTIGVLVWIALLLSMASVPWWCTLAGREVSGLWIVWGGLVGAAIGGLTPAVLFFKGDMRGLRSQGYSQGLFGIHQNAEETLKWDLWMILFTIVGFGIVTIPVGTLLGVGACLLAH